MEDHVPARMYTIKVDDREMTVTQEELAEMLTSEDIETVRLGISVLERMIHMYDIERSEFAEQVLHDLAFLKDGVVLKILMERMLFGTDEELQDLHAWYPHNKAACAGYELAFVSLSAVQTLARSRHIAKLLIRTLNGNTEKLVHRAIACARVDPHVIKRSYVYNLSARAIVCLTNFSYNSRKIRNILRTERSIFNVLLQLLSHERLRCLEPDSALDTRTAISRFLMILALHPDTQQWVVEQGFVRVSARICEASPADKDEGVSGCKIALILLLLNDDRRAQLKENGALKVFQPFSTMLQRSAPVNYPWWVLKEQLEGKKILGNEGYIRKKTEEFFDLVKVCSWSGCETREKYVPHLKLRRCARCSRAEYCR
jgi:hypothetical protein